MEAVASSKIKILGFLIYTLRKAINCLCPEDKVTPLSPTT